MGGRATTGKNVHVGAGAVLAGVIEPPSASPVVIKNNVLIGANAVILEGVRVGERRYCSCWCYRDSRCSCWCGCSWYTC